MMRPWAQPAPVRVSLRPRYIIVRRSAGPRAQRTQQGQRHHQQYARDDQVNRRMGQVHGVADAEALLYEHRWVIAVEVEAAQYPGAIRSPITTSAFRMR